MTEPIAATNGIPINEIVHQRHRLAILTIAAESDLVEFTYLKDALDLTAGNLSRHLSVLADAKMITVKKGYHRSRPRTWIRITRAGRKELASEIDALRALVQRHDAATSRGD